MISKSYFAFLPVNEDTNSTFLPFWWSCVVQYLENIYKHFCFRIFFFNASKLGKCFMAELISKPFILFLMRLALNTPTSEVQAYRRISFCCRRAFTPEVSF